MPGIRPPGILICACCGAKPFYCERMHPQLVNAILTNICSIVTNTIPRPAEPGRIVRVCPRFARRVCVFKMSRIGWAIRDTMSIGNDAPRVSVRKRGRPSFLVLLNARASNPGHSYLRLLRRKCLLPSAPRVRLRTLNRTSYESRNVMTNVPTAARAASALRNFSIWGPPIESSAARARDASQSHFTASTRTYSW